MILEADFLLRWRHYRRQRMNDNQPTTPAPPEREIFLAALEQTDPTLRAALLASACGPNLEMRRRIEELLGEQMDLGSFLSQPALGDTPFMHRPSAGGHGPAYLASVSEKAGDRIGRYRLLQQIGEGGCGIVFMAEQEEPVRRRVALKVIKLGMDSKSVIARFEAERQALAMMDHQHIARVLDAGATDTGRPFFVMELVRGIRITDYCDEHKLSTHERLMLFLQVCQAVQHAHQKGIIHRDLKPSNILVTVNDGIAVPKVIDFGIAKATEQRLTDKTLFTEFTAFIGTPAYMSPEQAEMSSLDIDTRSDIYSLGVVLYELMTGRTPFDAESLLQSGLDECRRTIREQEPIRPSTRLGDLSAQELTTMASQRCTDAPKLIHALQGDLDWIVMKCLEKDRTRRYATANALALDVQRHLDHEPVLARPPSRVYRMRKLLRRHRLVVIATAAVVLALLVGSTVSLWQAVRAKRAEGLEAEMRQQAEAESKRAQAGEAAARLNEYIADMNLAQQSLAAGNFGRAVQLVDKHRPKPGELDLRGFEWRFLWQLCQGDPHTAIKGQAGSVQAVAYAPNGRLVAVGSRDHLRVVDALTKSLVAQLPTDSLSLAFLPDGGTLVSAGRSGLHIWRTTDWAEQATLRDVFGPVAMSLDGSRLAAQGFGGARVFDTSTWEESRFFPGTFAPLAFSRDGKTLATDSRNGLTLWPLEGAHSEVVLLDSTNVFMRGGPWSRNDRMIAFSPDGTQLVAARNPPSDRGVFVLSIWDAASGRELAVMPSDPEHDEHTGRISAIAFSPDGQILATASFDHSIRLWDFPKRRLLRALHGHRNEVWALDFSPNGQEILTGAKDGDIRLWPVQPPRTEDFLPPKYMPLAFSKDGGTLATLHESGSVAFLNLASRDFGDPFDIGWARFGPKFGPPGANEPRPGGPPQPPSPRPNQGGPPKDGRGFGFMPAFLLSADLGTLVMATNPGTLTVIDTTTKELMTFKPVEDRMELAAVSPNGRVILTGGRSRQLRWYEPHTHTNALLTLDAVKGVFSSDGRLLATLEPPSTVQIWDVAGRAVLTNLVIQPAPGFPYPLVFSPDGSVLATTAAADDVDNGIHLWDTRTARLVGSCYGHKQPVQAVAFTPDGKTLASSADDGTVKLWNLATRQELLSVRKSGSPPRGLLFSPDGCLLIGGGSSFGHGWGGMPAPQSGLRVFRAPSLLEIDGQYPGAKPSR